MLSVKNLRKVYKSKNAKSVVALDNVSIDFPEKGFVFLLGKSGSGKSTLLNSIGGLDSFDSGEIIIKGKSSKNFSQSDFDSYRNTFIGFIFQEYNILENFTVAKNLALALELQGKKPKNEDIQRLLDQVDLGDYGKRKPNQLSGGQKQRVAIARALIKNPEIIMADEPTGALDSNTGKQVMDTLKELSKTKLVIVVSHDREFAELYGDRIIELKDGKILSDTTKKEIVSQGTEDDGIRIIDDNIIFIKKGQELSKEDINTIGKFVASKAKHSDAFISFDQKANQKLKEGAKINSNGNKEVFATTTPEDIQKRDYNPNSLKLIRSRLKFRDSFKMGASSLKSKVGKLIVTLLLSFFAFTAFGVIDSFASFNRPDSTYQSMQIQNTKTMVLEKQEKTDYLRTTSSDDFDLKELQRDFSDYLFKGVIYLPKEIQVKYNDSTHEFKYSSDRVYLNFSGMVNVNSQKELQELSFSMYKGNLPENNDEIAISKYMMDAMIFFSEDATFSITNDNIIGLEIGDIFREYYDSERTVKIVGVIDDGSVFDSKIVNDYRGYGGFNLTDGENLSAFFVYTNQYNFQYMKEKNAYNDNTYEYILTALNGSAKDKELVKKCESFDENGTRYTIQNATSQVLDSVENILISVVRAVLIVGIVFAVFAAISLMNFIATSISYKKREIGVLRALGARGMDVFGIFFNESMIIAGINFVLSSIATFIICHFANNSMVKDLKANLVLLNVGIRQVLLILFVSVVSALLACLIPVMRISKKKPVDAINNR